MYKWSFKIKKEKEKRLIFSIKSILLPVCQWAGEQNIESSASLSGKEKKEKYRTVFSF